jgi:hypothetical protein
MYQVTIDPQDANDESNDGTGYIMRLWRNGDLIMSSTSQSYANIHDPIEVAENAFGYGKGTSVLASDADAVSQLDRRVLHAQEPVELLIRRKTQPVETRRLR